MFFKICLKKLKYKRIGASIPQSFKKYNLNSYLLYKSYHLKFSSIFILIIIALKFILKYFTICALVSRGFVRNKDKIKITMLN